MHRVKNVFKYIGKVLLKLSEAILIFIGLVGILAFCYVLFAHSGYNAPKDSITTIVQPEIADKPKASVAAITPSIKVEKSEVITLNGDNSVTFDSVFEDNSVQNAMQELQKISNNLPKGATIYLVMNTPGGSVDAGLKLIAFAKALPQKVKTITIFAASMGFQTVQQLDERLILANGTLMSHPASFGVSGDTPYQVKSRLKWIMAMVDGLDKASADRMQLSFTDYQNLVHDEYWVYDDNAVKEHAADRKVFAKCGSFDKPSKFKNVDTLFGTFQLEVASCPLIPGYLSIKMPSNVGFDIINYIKLMYSDREAFTKEYIVNNRFQDYQL